MKVAQQLIWRVLYSLKRQFPGRVVLCRRIDSRLANVETGQKLLDIRAVSIERAVILPSSDKKVFFYDLAYIAAAKNFTYGAQADQGQRRFIVDARDLPGDFEPLQGDYIVYDGERYDLHEVEQFEFRAAFLLTGKRLLGSPLYAVYPLITQSTIHLTDAALGQVSIGQPIGQQLLLSQQVSTATVYSRAAQSELVLNVGAEDD